MSDVGESNQVDSHPTSKFPGRIGPYHVLSVLGRGASGDVYKAHDAELNRNVAVKLLAPELSRDEGLLQRFRTEAASAAQLHHPNIVQVFSAGEDNGQHFFAMQLVEGESLAARLKRERSVSPERAIRIAIDVLAGLAAAHAAGMVHRDIKPANILLATDGTALVVDFGLVKSAGQSQTITGVVLGTVDFISPEQASGDAVDGRSDLYSLGCVIYRMLSGRNPFSADNVAAVIFQHRYEVPVALNLLCAVPPQLAAVVHRLLEKDPQNRYQTASEVRDVLTGIPSQDSESLETRRPGDTSAAALPDGTGNLQPEAHLAPRPQATSLTAGPNRDLRAAEISSLPRSATWLQRTGRSLLKLLPGHASRVRTMELTQQQSDEAIELYENRCRKLRDLVVESERLCEELTGLYCQSTQAADKGREHRSEAGSQDAQRAAADQLARQTECRGLKTQLDEQRAQLSELRDECSQASRKLAVLRNQRTILLARLEVARARSSFVTGSQPRGTSGKWRIGAVLTLLLVLAIAAFLVSQHPKPSENPVTASRPRMPVKYGGDRVINSIGMEFVLIPAGQFTMGSPAREPGRWPDEEQHEVRITRPFHLGVHEVTVRQFRQFVADTNYRTTSETQADGGNGFGGNPDLYAYDPRFNWRNTGFAQSEDHPVVNVSWEDADAFARWLSRAESVQYRLPTEAEWEYACRAGTRSMFQTGMNPRDVTRIGNVADLAYRNELLGGSSVGHDPVYGNDGFVFTAPVGSFEPNAFGLFDMTGNVTEWCSDWFHHKYDAMSNDAMSPVDDPVGPPTGDMRVFRGGSWLATMRHFRSANRARYPATFRSMWMGFRLVRLEPDAFAGEDTSGSLIESTVGSGTHSPENDRPAVAAPAESTPTPDPTPTEQPEPAVEQIVRLPGKFSEVDVAGGGRYLVFNLSEMKKIAVLDVVERKVAGFIDTDEPAQCAAGEEKIYVVLPTQRVIQRWNLTTLEREKVALLQLDSDVSEVAMGHASFGPILVGGRHRSASFQLLDPDRLAPLEVNFTKKSPHDRFSVGADSRVRASANGEVFTSWGTDGSPAGVMSMSLNGDQPGIRYLHDTFGHIAPSADGSRLFTCQGTYTPDLTLIGENAEMFATSFPVPAVQGRYYLKVERIDNADDGDKQPAVSICVPDEDQPLAVLTGVKIRAGRYADFFARDTIPLDQRIYFIPDHDVLVTLPESDDSVVFRKTSIDRTLEESGIDFLFFTSSPPLTAQVGAVYEYQISAKSNHTDLEFEFGSAPEGMDVTENGRVTWTPQSGDAGSHAIVVSISNAAGSEATQSFQLDVAPSPTESAQSLSANAVPGEDSGAPVDFLASAPLVPLNGGSEFPPFLQAHSVVYYEQNGLRCGRNYVRSKSRTMFADDFTFEVRFLLPEKQDGDNTTTFIGLGTRDRGAYDEPESCAYLRIPSLYVGNGVGISNRPVSSVRSIGAIRTVGPHLARIRKRGDLVRFEIDVDSDGPSPDDISTTVSSLAEFVPILHGKNAHVFFGGAAIFTEVSLNTASDASSSDRDDSLPASAASGNTSTKRIVAGMKFKAEEPNVELTRLGSKDVLPDFLTTASTFERTDDEGIRLQAGGVIRSRRNNMLNTDFTFEVLVEFQRGDEIAYIGLGPGVKDSSHRSLADSVYLRLHAPWHGDGGLDVENWRFGRTPFRGKVDYAGVHRVHISKRGKVVTFLVDPDNDGPSDDDMNLVIPDITAHSDFLTSENSTLFLSGSGTFLQAGFRDNAPALATNSEQDETFLGQMPSLPDFIRTDTRYVSEVDGGLRILGGGPIKSLEKDFVDRDFTFELLVRFERTDTIAYIGLGQGKQHRSDGFEDSIFLRLHPPDLRGGADVQNWHGGSIPVKGNVVSRGDHLMRIIKHGSTVTFQIDPENDGPTNNFSVTIPDIKEFSPFLNSKNSYLFFGGGGTYLSAKLLE